MQFTTPAQFSAHSSALTSTWALRPFGPSRRFQEACNVTAPKTMSQETSQSVPSDVAMSVLLREGQAVEKAWDGGIEVEVDGSGDRMVVEDMAIVACRLPESTELVAGRPLGRLIFDG